MMDAMTSFNGGFQPGKGGGNGGIREMNYGGPQGGAFRGAFGNNFNGSQMGAANNIINSIGW